MTGGLARQITEAPDVAVVRRCRRAALLGTILLAAPWSRAAADLDSISPRAFRPGVAAEIQFSGRDLAGATDMWRTFPASFEALDGGRWRMKPRADCPVGIGALRLAGSNGVSSLALVMIDDLPTERESKTNKTQAAAQRVRIGTAVDGECNELGLDWFQLRADKNQRVAIEVVAARFGSRLDSVVRVLDAAGRIVAQNDDAPGLNADSFVSFTASENVDYCIELRDVNYGGGSEFFYHLRVGDYPLATTSFPVAAEQGSRRSFHLVGPAGSAGRVESAVSSNVFAIPLAVKGRIGSTFATALATTNHEITEREPNDTAASSTRISASDGINGRFDKAGDRDCYQFPARKGQRLEFRAATRSVGSPGDVLLEIQSADGARLARSNPSAADEGIVTHRFASNGTYRLIVEEVTGAFGPNYVYRIDARPAPGFELTVDNDRVNVAAGQSFDLKVTCVRGDYKGPVTLAVDAGDPRFTVTNNVIAEGKTNTTAKVTLPGDLPPGGLRHFSVSGTATRDGAAVHVRASTAPALRRRFPQMLYSPVEFDGIIALGVTVQR